jgi:hypothetical protein
MSSCDSLSGNIALTLSKSPVYKAYLRAASGPSRRSVHLKAARMPPAGEQPHFKSFWLSICVADAARFAKAQNRELG